MHRPQEHSPLSLTLIQSFNLRVAPATHAFVVICCVCFTGPVPGCSLTALAAWIAQGHEQQRPQAPRGTSGGDNPVIQ